MTFLKPALISGHFSEKWVIEGILETAIECIFNFFNRLRPGRSGNRIPVGAKFSAPVHTGPGAYQASYTMGTESLSWC
jgi:hypothetical protein